MATQAKAAPAPAAQQAQQAQQAAPQAQQAQHAQQVQRNSGSVEQALQRALGASRAAVEKQAARKQRAGQLAGMLDDPSLAGGQRVAGSG